MEWKQVREGGSEKLLDSGTLLEVGGRTLGLTFEEGGSIPQKYCAFVFLPAISVLLLDSIATVRGNFTPNKYLPGIFSRSVP